MKGNFYGRDFQDSVNEIETEGLAFGRELEPVGTYMKDNEGDITGFPLKGV